MSGAGRRFWRGSIVDSIMGLNNLASILDRFNARVIGDAHDISRDRKRRGPRLSAPPPRLNTKGDDFMTPIRVGADAPDFTVFAPPGGANFKLSEQRGRPAVLMFVPLAFTSTCTEEFCHVAENWAQWGELGADVVGISVDSPFVNQKWGEEMGAPFPILSDFNKEAVSAYGVLQDELIGLRGVARRSVFVVDGDGRVAYAWVAENPGILPPFDEIVEAVQTVA